MRRQKRTGCASGGVGCFHRSRQGWRDKTMEDRVGQMNVAKIMTTLFSQLSSFILSWHGDFWRERRVRNQQSTDYADLRRFFFRQNGASGASDIEGKGAQGSTERVRAASEFQFTEFYGIKSSD